ncbi:MAG: DUF4430 domain-containing protein [Candidatus Nomurabacteria bacterium]|nr:DUF4430 domain-containing protein [Candidatus Nomurabacteria bacterium]
MLKKEKTKILIIIIIFIALFGIYFFNSQIIIKKIPSLPDKVFKDNIPGEISVYDFMSKLRSEGKINFTEKNYIGMGEFIEEINGIKNGEKNWIYYINGKKANIGVSNYKINEGDIISWKYEKNY